MPDYSNHPLNPSTDNPAPLPQPRDTYPQQDQPNPIESPLTQLKAPKLNNSDICHTKYIEPNKVEHLGVVAHVSYLPFFEWVDDAKYTNYADGIERIEGNSVSTEVHYLFHPEVVRAVCIRLEIEVPELHQRLVLSKRMPNGYEADELCAIQLLGKDGYYYIAYRQSREEIAHEVRVPTYERHYNSLICTGSRKELIIDQTAAVAFVPTKTTQRIDSAFFDELCKEQAFFDSQYKAELRYLEDSVDPWAIVRDGNNANNASLILAGFSLAALYHTVQSVFTGQATPVPVLFEAGRIALTTILAASAISLRNYSIYCSDRGHSILRKVYEYEPRDYSQGRIKNQKKQLDFHASDLGYLMYNPYGLHSINYFNDDRSIYFDMKRQGHPDLLYYERRCEKSAYNYVHAPRSYF